MHGTASALAFKSSKEDAAFTYVTWTSYFSSVMDVSKALVALGVHPGETISILGFNHQHWYYACFGSIFAGAVVAGIYLTNTAAAVTYQIEHSKSKVVFVDSLAQLEKAQRAKEVCSHLEFIVMWPNTLEKESVPHGISGVLSWDEFIAAEGASIERLAAGGG